MVIFSDGFESGTLSAWSGTVGTPGVQSLVKHHGTFAMTGSAGNYVYNKCYKTISAAPNVYLRYYFQINTVPAIGDFIVTCPIQNSTGIISRIVIRRPVGDILLTAQNRVVAASFDYVWNSLAVGKWYCIEFQVIVHDTAGEINLWLDGVQVVKQTGLDTDNNADVTEVGMGIDSTAIAVPAKMCFFDCAVIDSNRIFCEIEKTLRRNLIHVGI